MADPALDAKVNAVATSAADKLVAALEKLVTVTVVTSVGDGALQGELERVFREKHKDANPPPNMPEFKNTKGAFTAVNMATGDITVSYAEGVVDMATIKTLHDEAVAKGTEIFRQNVRTLAEVVGTLYDKLRA
jgi:hypothetical protein